MADITSQNRDADGDGMVDATNAKMPAISFVTAIVGLIPTLYALQYSIDVMRGVSAERMMAFVMNFLSIACATGAIVAAAYGARAATRGLATGGRWIAIIEMLIAILLVVMLFFTKS